MAERFLVRTEGGPRAGTRVAENWAWPLPELLLADGGSYVKVSESDLPPQPEDSRLLRGAQYEWQPGDATAPQLSKAISVAIKARRFEEVPTLLTLLALQDPGDAAEVYELLSLVTGARDG